MREKKASEFVGAVIGAIIGLVVVNSVPLWRSLTNGVVLESWGKILWAADLSLITQMVANTFLAIYRPARLFSFFQAVVAAAGLISVIVFYQVFPLDFSQVVGNWLNVLTRVLLVLGIVGSALAVMVHLVRSVIGTQYKPSKTAPSPIL